MTWLRTNKIIQSFIKTVDESKCIYSNRWGDSPLWGAAIVLTNQPYTLLPIPYYHGSHHSYVTSNGKIILQSRFYIIRWFTSFFIKL